MKAAATISAPTEAPDVPRETFRSGVLLAVTGTFLFALKSIFIKLSFAAGATPVPLLTIRMVFALPFYVVTLLFLLRSRGAKTCHVERYAGRAFLLGFLGYYLASYLDLSGLQRITAQLERLTLFTYPTIVAVLAWMFLGESLNRKILASIILCYCGIFLMFQSERAMLDGAQVGIGVLLVLGSALSYSLYILFAKPTMQRIGSPAFTSIAMLGSTFFVVVHFVSTESLITFVDMQPIVYVYGLALAFICTVLPSFMINEAIVRLGATRTTVIGSAGPAFTMLLAIVILQEPSSWQHLLGMLTVIIGVSLVARK